MVAQGPLEAFVMVRIHAGQPVFRWKTRNRQVSPKIPQTFREGLGEEDEHRGVKVTNV
jgi:hypothetical protein